DGSGFQKGVGAAAVLYRDGEEQRVLRYRLGHEDDHEVYEAKCVGMVMGLHMATQEDDITELSIWADNTAAITATDTPKTGSAHYILDMFHELLNNLRQMHPAIPVTISWVPGHKGVEGNERADQEAKRAATTRSSTKRTLPAQLRAALP
ncbi:ribonuclease H-like domain-containing protein, partial [Lentinula raphanica]